VWIDPSLILIPDDIVAHWCALFAYAFSVSRYLKIAV
jgi:hypothetical protein